MDSASSGLTSNFATKLYNMLEDSQLETIVSWGPKGDCFLVHDMTEFIATVLPRLFKHSNLASFVRQLNKYEFHKTKSSELEEEGFNENSWVFRHPEFRRGRPEALEYVKRKAASEYVKHKVASKRSSDPYPQHQPLPVQSPPPSPSPIFSYSPPPPPPSDIQILEIQILHLTHSQNEMHTHMQNIGQNYHGLFLEVIGFHRSMSQQDGLMNNLIQAFQLQQESGEYGRGPG